MDAQLQPSPPPTVYSSANPQVHSQLPVSPQSSTHSYQGPISTPPTRDASSNFSASDAANVVCRGLATVNATLDFFGRTISIYAIKVGALIAGGIKGVLRYTHESESLNNRTVQPALPMTVQSHSGSNPAGQSQVEPNQTGQSETVQSTTSGQTPDTGVSGKMPLEEYVRVDATDTLNSIPKSIQILGTIGGLACALFTPYFFLGPLGLIFFIPRIFGVKPYTVFEALSDESQQMPTLPVTSQQDSSTNQQPGTVLNVQPSISVTEGSTAVQNYSIPISQQTSLQQIPITFQQPQESTVPYAQVNTIAPQPLPQMPHQSATTTIPIITPNYPQNTAPQVQPAAQQPTIYQSSLHTHPMPADGQQVSYTPTTSQPVISTQPTQSTPENSSPLWNSINQNVSRLVPYIVS